MIGGAGRRSVALEETSIPMKSTLRVVPLVCALVVVFATPMVGTSQRIPVGDPWEDYVRVLQILGKAPRSSFNIRPTVELDVPARPGESHPWEEHLPTTVVGSGPSVSVTGARAAAFVNSAHPWGQNDGAVWQGRGMTTALGARADLKWAGLVVVLDPTLLFTQNAEFDLAGVSNPNLPSFAYPWRTIDYPQRFGSESYWTFDPGQSGVTLDVRGVRVGFGTANLWWGPSMRNAIIMSNNAPGFTHASISTARQVATPLGDVEAQWIHGRLGQSDWFDATANPERFITGLAVSYSPGFLDELSIGFTRVFIGLVPSGGTDLGDYFLVFQGFAKKAFANPSNPGGDDEHDQLFSLFARWELPASGFEVYTEWARNDHSWDLTDFVREPEHSQAYTLGFRKAVEISGNRVVTMTGELSQLEGSSTFQSRGVKVTYYAHHVVTQGYTHEGQLLGAGVGPGGNAQFLGVDLYSGRGKVGWFLERRIHDNDAYYDWQEVNNRGYCCHDVSLTGGTSTLFFVDRFELEANASLTREMNRYFDGPHVWNVNLGVSARWRGR